MTNMLDIGRSGLLAYRGALAVTSENVANVGTDGYRRRDVATVAAGGGQATATSAPTGGQGVTVVDIRRAFDGLVAERARSAQAGLSAAEAHLAGASAIETLMIPGDDGIDGTLRDFFDSVARLAANPTDMVTRALTLRSGEALAEGISGLARGLGALRTDILAEARAVVGTAQGLLGELAQVSRSMGGLSAPGAAGAAAQHPLADRRDALLDDLARLLPVSVALSEAGRPTIRLGGAAGPLLLDGDRTARLDVSGADQLTLHVAGADGVARDTRLLADGRLGGVSRALGALDMAAQELDAFARTLSGSMNAVHRGGVDLTGAPGGDLFATDGWRGVPAAANGGSVRFDLAPLPGAAAGAFYELVFDGAAALWRAHDASGAEVASARETLLLPGVRVDLAGVARDGDRIALRSVTGHAADLRMAVADPAALAAAGSFATAPSPGNAGTARLSAVMLPVAQAHPSALAPASGDAPLDLLGGVVGHLAAGTTAVDLVSLGRAATTIVPPLPGALRLEVAPGAGIHAFDIAGFPGVMEMVDALTGGDLRSIGGRSLASLGLVASVDGHGNLALARPGHPTPAEVALIGPDTRVPGVGHPREAAGGTMQILTRNGVHVAGTPLTATEAAALITPQNGFLAGAAYDPSALNLAAGVGYRGIGLSRLDLPGVNTAVLPAPALRQGTDLPPAAEAARSLALSDASGRSATVEVPQGASAALIAARIDGALPGIAAMAVTGLELSGFPKGAVRFDLTGANGRPIEVSATLSDQGAGPLAQAINGLTAATGIAAQVSPDGARLLLVQADGHDIAVSRLMLAGGAGLMARPSGPDGQPAGTPADWPAGTALRQGGQVSLSAPQGFALTDAGTGLAIAAAPQASGSHDLTTAAAGAEARLRFHDIPAQAEGGLAFSLDLGGRTQRVALPAAATGPAIAAALAEELRRGAPDAVLTGASLAALPPDGSAMVLRVEGTDHTLRMQSGVPVVTGPEAGRITASFDSANRLNVTARCVTGGGGIGIAATPAFGLAAGAGVLRLMGQPPDTGALPAEVMIGLAGTMHRVVLNADGGVAVPPGFPGTATRDAANGALMLELSAPAPGLQVEAEAASGFAGPGVAVRVQGDTLVLAGRSAPLDLRVTAQGALGQRIEAANLPPEDLVVAVTGSGTLRLGGTVDPGPRPADPGALDLVVTDAARGAVTLRDRISGHDVARGVLDAAGRVSLGGLALTLSGTTATGDRFALLPAVPGSANADTALALAALRNADAATGRQGLTDAFARIQADAGLRVAAAGRTVATARAGAEAADRAQAAIGAVDLDVEAARLLELQQAYQASAQTLSIARDLFDTILRLF